MNNKLLQQILENNKNYEKISSIEDIDNFIDILENTKEVLIKKRRELVKKDVQNHIDFSKEVYKLIKSKNEHFNFKKEENTLLDEIYDKTEGAIIYCDINGFSIYISIGQGEEYIYICVYSENEKRINKLKNIYIDNELSFLDGNDDHHIWGPVAQNDSKETANRMLIIFDLVNKIK
ncbi:hypothetical protein Q5M87_12805 [Brachyspira innocens]|uniref:hypothetical protein n=1 Tax=Brachyspira innocens TaxID=13264 RepID=UPI0026F1BEC3|nr:hypothetical protein [Brachyspira innocens]MDO6994887.1 hypothetical protein [Brachyspira innocens]